MFPQIKIGNRPTSASAISEFERSVSVRLPQLYRDFLLATNGGLPVEPNFSIVGMPLNPEGAVHAFLGIGARFASEDLVTTFRYVHGSAPRDIVPIGCTAGDDFICLDLRGGRNKVVFWDQSHYWGTGEWREQDVYAVTGSFEDFLSSLRPNPL